MSQDIHLPSVMKACIILAAYQNLDPNIRHRGGPTILVSCCPVHVNEGCDDACYFKSRRRDLPCNVLFLTETRVQGDHGCGTREGLICLPDESGRLEAPGAQSAMLHTRHYTFLLMFLAHCFVDVYNTWRICSKLISTYILSLIFFMDYVRRSLL